jgi:hypothetical protein
MKNTALTIYIVFLIIAAGFGVGAATQAGVLIQAAVPFALVLILVMYFMGAKAELISWAAFTVGLLAGTYLQTGTPIEYLMFFVYIILSALGIFKSPYFLALAWLFHPIWDALPRDLPAQMKDLPLACALFDTPIGLYLLWGAWKKRWVPFGEDATNKAALIRSGKTIFIGVLIMAVSSAIVAAIDSGYLNWVALASSIMIIIGFRFMGETAELIAWAVLTGWLGMTYAHTGGMADALFFFAYVAISALGVFKSPYFLGIAWLVFIPYSFLPHHAHHMSPDFALASVFYCLPAGLYLLWGSWKNRWAAFHKKPASAPLEAVISD